MITQHPSFEYIPDETVLWQYMSITKFLFLIKNKKLHFHRIDDFLDKNEGILSILDKKSLPFYKDTEEWKRYCEEDRKRFFISCWIKSPIEQSLMWYAYGKNGIAIRSTAGAMMRSMEFDKEHDVKMIGVRYIDKDKQTSQIPGREINWWHYFTTKRKFFEMENEVRLLFFDQEKKYKEKGINLDVITNELIQEIKVDSTMPEFEYNLICQETINSGLNVLPEKSNL